MSRVMKSLIAAAAIGGLTAFVVGHAPAARAQDQATPAAADDLPPGGDHDLVKATCTQCHQSSQFTDLRKDAAGWSDIVNEMGAMGAVIPDENIPKIVAYLTANFGPNTPAPGAAAPAGSTAPAAPAATPAPADDMTGPAQ